MAEDYEDFVYTQDRLSQINTNGIPSFMTMSYDNYGNITNKSDVTTNAASYKYGLPSKPHTLTAIGADNPDTDFPSAIDKTSPLSVAYTPYNQAHTITHKGYTTTYQFGTDYSRNYSATYDGANTLVQSRIYIGDYEVDKRIENGNEVTRNIHYVSGGDGMAAIIVKQGSTYTHYAVYTDVLGSILRLTNTAGIIVDAQSFDAWGRYRKPDDWSNTTATTTTAGILGSNGWLRRGYTGHEHLQQQQLIHMNGRVYDPIVGRFLSPDPYLQDPADADSYNRYAYVLNNPMKYTDPSGYIKISVTLNSHGECGCGAGEVKLNNWALLSNSFHTPDDIFLSPSNYIPSSFTGLNFSINDILQYWGINIPNLDNNASYHIDFLGNGNYAVANLSNSDFNVYEGQMSVEIGSFYHDAQGNPITIDNVSGSFGIIYLDIPNRSGGGWDVANQGGGLPGWMGDANTGIGAFGLANGAKTEIIDYAIRSNYKTAQTWGEFNKLRPTQQAWRTTNTLGKTGAQYLKYAKGLGYVGAGLSTTYSIVNAGSYYYNGGGDWQVGAKATLDVIMTGVGFLGPIGFGVSATYFILDNSTGNFGGFGQIKP